MAKIDDELERSSATGDPQVGWAQSLLRWSCGEVREAVAASSTMHAEAMANGDLPAARLAAVSLARYVLNLGHPAWASRILDEVDLLAARSGDEPPHPLEVTLAALVRGRVAELRGDWPRAEAIFAEAISWLDGEGETFARDATRVGWATTVAMLSDESATAVVAEMEALRSACPHENMVKVAGIPLGLAVGALGDGDRGVALVRDALDGWDMPADNAQVLVRLGELECRLRRCDAAVATFTEALEVLERVGGSYWTARALCGLGHCQPERSVELVARARMLSDGDPAFDRLFVREDTLQVRLRGDVGVSRGGQPVAFAGRQAEFVVLALAAAAPGQLSLAELCDVLWPSPDPKRLPQRVRTLLWQVRRALGSESWRLGRDGDRLWLDVRGLELVGADGEPDTLLDGWHHVGDVPRQWLATQLGDLEPSA